MKKFLIVMLSVCFMASVANAAPPAPGSLWKIESQSVAPLSDRAVQFPRYTVATLPTLSAGDTGSIVQVTDGVDATDCASGSGSTMVQCRWDGSAWENAGDGTSEAVGSGSMTTVKSKGVQVGGADQVTLDFGAGFTVSESPDTESNVGLDITPTDVVATLRQDLGGLEVKYDSSLTKSASGLGINADGVDSQHYAADSIDNEHVNWGDIDYLDNEGALVVADTTDTTAFVALFDSATGSEQAKTDASNLTYNATTGVLTAAGFVGPITGNVTGDVTGDVTGTASGNDTLASADFANQGTTTTLLHGNAAGNPSWTSVVLADLDAGVYAKDIVTTSPITGGENNVLVGADGDLTLALDMTAAWDFSAATISLPADAVDAITEIAAALKSGDDTTLITGTAGTDTYTAVWNADGDLVDGFDPASKADAASPTFTGVITLPSAADPTTDADGELAVDIDGWGTDHDAIEFYDGTASTKVLVTADNTPSDGQVATWNTGGTVTWEDAGVGDVLSVGDCTEGACLDGADADSGTYIALWDGDSHKLTIDAADLTGDATVVLGSDTNTLTIANGTASLQVDGEATTITGAGQANTLTLNESLTVGDGNSGTLTYSAGSKTLTVEDSAIVSQDMTSDASPQFAGIELSHASENTLTASGGVLSIEGAALAVSASPTFTGIITLPSAADPTTDAEAEIGVDTGVWGNAGIDAIEFFDGSASTYIIGVRASDTPDANQVPKWNADGSITWEDDSTGTGLGTSLSSSTNEILSGAASSGVLILGGDGGTYDEALSLDFESTENEVGVSSSTGVATVDFGSINLETDVIDAEQLTDSAGTLVIGAGTETIAISSSDWTISTTGAIENAAIDADSNNIANIDNGEIKAAAGIDATKIGDGSVSSTEFQYLDGLGADLAVALTTGTVNITTLLNVDEDVDIDFDAADEEINIAQASATGTADTPLIAIDDNRTGATADVVAEATIWIDAEGVYGLAIVDGAAYVESDITSGADIYAGDDIYLSSDDAAIHFGSGGPTTITHDSTDDSLVVNNVFALDDGTTDSPALKFINASDEYMQFVETDAGGFHLDAATGSASYIALLPGASSHVVIQPSTDGYGLYLSDVGNDTAIQLTVADGTTVATLTGSLTVTADTVLGDASTDSITAVGYITGDTGEPVQIHDGTLGNAWTYADDPNDLGIEGTLEVQGTVYAPSFASTDATANDSWIGLSNNADSGVTAAASIDAASYTYALGVVDASFSFYNGSSWSSFAAYSDATPTWTTATPIWEINSSTDADDIFNFNVNNDGNNDMVLQFGIEDSVGESSLYLELDGVNKTVDIAQNITLPLDKLITFGAGGETISSDDANYLDLDAPDGGIRFTSPNINLYSSAPYWYFTDTDFSGAQSYIQSGAYDANDGVLQFATAIDTTETVMFTINGQDELVEAKYPVTIDDGGVKLTGSNGTLTIAGLGDGQDENLVLDFNTTADSVDISSGTSVAGIDFGSLNLVTTGTFGAGAITGTSVTDGNVTLAGDGTITGVSVGGLPDNIVDNGMMADNAIDSDEITGAAIDESHLNATNAPTDDYVLTYDDGSGGFTWVEVSGTGDLKADGTVPLTAAWDVGAYVITASGFVADSAGVDITAAAGLILQNDETITNATDTQILLTADSGENLAIDLDTATDNQIELSSPGGATELSAGSLNFVTTGVILGGINIHTETDATYTVGTDDASEAYGTAFINGDDDAIDFTLPSAVAGMMVCFYQGQGVTGAITVQPNTGDYLVVDGARGTAATDYASVGAAEDRLCAFAASADDWIVTMTDGTWAEP